MFIDTPAWRGTVIPPELPRSRPAPTRHPAPRDSRGHRLRGRLPALDEVSFITAQVLNVDGGGPHRPDIPGALDGHRLTTAERSPSRSRWCGRPSPTSTGWPSGSSASSRSAGGRRRPGVVGSVRAHHVWRQGRWSASGWSPRPQRRAATRRVRQRAPVPGAPLSPSPCARSSRTTRRSWSGSASTTATPTTEPAVPGAVLDRYPSFCADLAGYLGSG